MSLRVINPGFISTIQDFGRIGFASSGIPQSGVMDTYTPLLLNILLGNKYNEAVIEMNLLGGEYEFLESNLFVLGGADSYIYLNGDSILNYRVYLANKGNILKIGMFKRGVRLYLGVYGGFDLPIIMGSKSTDMKLKIGGIEGRRLKSGDNIKFLNPKISINNLSQRWIYDWLVKEDLTKSIRVILGPQQDYFTAKGLKNFLNSSYTISVNSDRMGLRLDGTSIEHKHLADIPSDAIAFGAIQVPQNGKPIILMADRQTTGGYAKIANIISFDIPRLSQTSLNSQINFEIINIKDAQNLLKQRFNFINKLNDKLNN